MLLVIVGAGASFDCVDSTSVESTLKDKNRPPLTNTLFEGKDADAVLSQVPVSLAAVSDMRDELPNENGAVERVLEKWRAEAHTKPYRRERLYALRFFLQRRLENTLDWSGITWCHGLTNYVHLARHLDAWADGAGETVLYVTFNYDTILDRALESMSLIDTTEPSGYMSGQRAKLFKVHGSINWWHETEIEVPSGGTEQWSRHVVSGASPSNISPDIVVRDRSDFGTVDFGGPHRGYLPAIAIPVVKKDESEFECPREHLETLEKLLPQVTRVLAVGWRGEEEHFLRLMARSRFALHSIAAISGTTEGAIGTITSIMDNMGPGFERPDPWWPYVGFSEFLRSKRWEVLEQQARR